MSFADLDEALGTAQRAIVLDPNLSRTQTVLGFAYLSQVDTRNAKAAFEKAIESDEADYLPRLGLGLAKVREGDLPEGRREIEIAASLDSNNSLVRSYLGKAYFEEKRAELTDREYATAKELDPKDPTPFFYDAIQKQTTNRPVEALQDLEKAIELNENRAVYRSRLLLESDLAARSASLGRIYSDLGFQQLALVEGWKSVNTDPSNFSAHRFLADSYSVLPRHEIARVSELLQSQLLQPLNMTPIQPHLAESNLFLLSAQGPAALSFNEFNPLFNRNGVNFQTTGFAGENSTYGGEGVLSGIYKKAAFSLGGFHFQTDGWRRNADQRDTIANAFLQMELTPQTSVQAEIRRRETEFGDLQQQFFFETFSPNLRDVRKAWSVRLGARHAFSPGSTLLGSFVFQDRSGIQIERDPFFPIESRIPQSALGIEFQHLLRTGKLNVTSGVGYFDVDAKSTDIFRDTSPPTLESARLDLQHFNAYTYANLNLWQTVTLTGGATFDYLWGRRASVRDGQQDQFSPKVGISWTPLKGTLVRAAATRTFKRTLINDATLEPTQVAGFNQFFDEINGTKAWRYGAAIDQVITQNSFGGIELSMRDPRIPVITSPSTARTVDANEYAVRSYLFWAPQPWVALRSEYMFERFDKAPLPIDNFRVSTHRLPLGINVFHPAGWTGSVTTTYYHQSGEFLRSGLFQSASSDFWTVDAALTYRLPRRLGTMTFGATNLFDRRFKYFDTDRNNPRIQPTRMIFVRATFAVP
jgi:tetratricopeptide (TPR) repeat protein